MPRKPRRSVRSKALESAGPVRIPATDDRGAILAITEAMSVFGGEPHVRIYRDRLQGNRCAVVSLRYTNLRAMVGPLSPELAARLGPALMWNSLRHRVISAPATVDTDPNSPTYLHVWINERSS